MYNPPYPSTFFPRKYNPNLKQKTQSNSMSNHKKISNQSDKKEDNHKQNIESINILGFKLYLDDLIILFILFILYKEKINDNELMICLILLLLN